MLVPIGRDIRRCSWALFNRSLCALSLQVQCGVNFFILDSRRVLAPAPKVLGSDIKTHLKSRFCLQAILKKRGAM